MAEILASRAGKPVPKKNPLFNSFASWVRELRTARGLTQGELGKLMSMQWTSTVRIEAASIEVPLSTLVKLATALGVEPGELFPPPAKGK